MPGVAVGNGFLSAGQLSFHGLHLGLPVLDLGARTGSLLQSGLHLLSVGFLQSRGFSLTLVDSCLDRGFALDAWGHFRDSLDGSGQGFLVGARIGRESHVANLNANLLLLMWSALTGLSVAAHTRVIAPAHVKLTELVHVFKFDGVGDVGDTGRQSDSRVEKNSHCFLWCVCSTSRCYLLCQSSLWETD
uniref:Uncharacterized protein n=1 Tax=Favella ehrenbergii TaxID=182087 RepID=A0A7S3MNT6_9SPIT|mmetsp:Transcript_24327/g.30170  ORF Transcript_24327/g.30170 Transcript_24327/m.30170 type:complete len:189 (+) Transcript_24327:1598-2164(+)